MNEKNVNGILRGLWKNEPAELLPLRRQWSGTPYLGVGDVRPSVPKVVTPEEIGRHFRPAYRDGEGNTVYALEIISDDAVEVNVENWLKEAVDAHSFPVSGFWDGCGLEKEFGPWLVQIPHGSFLIYSDRTFIAMKPGKFHRRYCRVDGQGESRAAEAGKGREGRIAVHARADGPIPLPSTGRNGYIFLDRKRRYRSKHRDERSR